MPPWEFRADCRDDFYVQFDNASTVPWLSIGRWPVQSNEELQAIVSKTISYANTPLYGPWKNTVTFATDDEWKGGACGNPAEKEHTLVAESLINTVLPKYFTFKKIYEIFYPFRSSATGAIKSDATRDLMEAINRGTLIVSFAGHGNERIWTDEQLFVMDRDHNSAGQQPHVADVPRCDLHVGRLRPAAGPLLPGGFAGGLARRLHGLRGRDAFHLYRVEQRVHAQVLRRTVPARPGGAPQFRRGAAAGQGAGFQRQPVSPVRQSRAAAGHARVFRARDGK